MERAKQQGPSYRLAAKVGTVNHDYEKAENTNQTMKTLLTWFQFDGLPLTSVVPQQRELLYDFILEELSPFLHIERINKFYKSMVNQRTHLLKVIYQLDRHRLALFQFILNHRPFACSEHQNHKGKSAAELMSATPHPPWFYTIFTNRLIS